MKEIIDTLSKANNEYTSSPYWLILDPKQNMACDVHMLAAQITGPFFCREDAESFLSATRYNFSSKAVVYGLSGCHSAKYTRLWEAVEKQKKPEGGEG